MKTISMLRCLVAIACLSVTGLGSAATGWLQNATVTRLSYDVRKNPDETIKYGGCVAYIANPGPKSVDSQCLEGWVAFDCAGLVGSKSDGRNKYDTATLAKVASYSVNVNVNSNIKLNGACFVQAILVNETAAP